jgi:hypothetical protein
LANLIAGYSVIVLCFHKKFGVTTSGKTSFGDYLHMLVNQAFIFLFCVVTLVYALALSAFGIAYYTAL